MFSKTIFLVDPPKRDILLAVNGGILSLFKDDYGNL
jgi:hypothetical protein